MTDAFVTPLAGTLHYDPAFPYIFDSGTRALYAFALQSRYLESGSWPEGGLSIPEETARVYMSDAAREGRVITKSGETFSIVDA